MFQIPEKMSLHFIGRMEEWKKRGKFWHVSNFPENNFTLWKDGRMEASTSNLPSFHPSNHTEISETCHFLKKID